MPPSFTTAERQEFQGNHVCDIGDDEKLLLERLVSVNGVVMACYSHTFIS